MCQADLPGALPRVSHKPMLGIIVSVHREGRVGGVVSVPGPGGGKRMQVTEGS